MKIRLLSILCLLFVGCGHTLFDGGESQYSIALCADASESEQMAAEELQSYIQQISGAELPIKRSDELQEGEKHIFIGYNEEYGAELGVEHPDAESQTYTYRTVGPNIWIYGGKRWGTMYGVSAFLENELGVRGYATDYTKIVPQQKWSFKSLNHSESPAITFRFNDSYAEERDYGWMGHNKCNSIWSSVKNKYGGLVGFWGGHTFAYFVPAKEFFATHPEYFAMRDGERVAYGQLCLSNPEVIEICKERMKRVIADNPDYWVYSLSQDDHQFMCQCDKCRALEEQYGGHSGLLIWFVNQVADAIKPLYPDKYIGTFAYMYTRHPPVGIVPRDNVVIRLCSLECCRAHPIEGCEHNQSFMADSENWSKIAPNIYIWDYVVNFHQYVAPFPNFNVLAENIRTFIKYDNVIGVRQQANYQSIGGEFCDMKAWVLSKLLWNPYQDTQKLVLEFITDYYGEAAPYIKEYFDLCHSLIKEDTEFDIYIDANDPLYTNEFVAKAKEILAKAQQAVASADEEMRLRVDMVALQIDYLRMYRTPEQTLADGTNDRVWNFARKHEIRMGEWYDIEETIQLYNEKYLAK